MPKIVGRVIQAGQDAALIVGGKAASSFVARMIPIGETPPMRLAANVIAAAAVGMAAGFLLSADMSRLVMAGALVAPIESFIRSANIPVLSPALGDDVLMGYYGPGSSMMGVGAYPAALPSAGVGAYPAGQIEGEWEGYGAGGGF